VSDLPLQPRAYERTAVYRFRPRHSGLFGSSNFADTTRASNGWLSMSAFVKTAQSAQYSQCPALQAATA
jgi:hypothetical protein